MDHGILNWMMFVMINFLCYSFGMDGLERRIEFSSESISFCPPMFLENKWYCFKCYTCFRFYRFVPMFLEKIRQKKKFLKELQIHFSWLLVTDLENLIWSYYLPLSIYFATLVQHLFLQTALMLCSLWIPNDLGYVFCIDLNFGVYLYIVIKKIPIKKSSQYFLLLEKESSYSLVTSTH